MRQVTVCHLQEESDRRLPNKLRFEDWWPDFVVEHRLFRMTGWLVDDDGRLFCLDILRRGDDRGHVGHIQEVDEFVRHFGPLHGPAAKG